MSKKIIVGKTVSSNKDTYSRIKIDIDQSLYLFENLNKITVIYNKDYFIRKLNLTFYKYGEINSYKIKEWSNNKKADIEIDISELKKGILKIVKIINNLT